MTILANASHQWVSRPADERFTSLPQMLEHFKSVRSRSRETVVASRRIEARPDPTDHQSLALFGPEGGRVTPTHWAFGQLCQLAEAPAGYLRAMPGPIVADCLNWGLRYKRDVEDVGILLTRCQSPGDAPGGIEVRACTGPRYGRIWNSEIIQGLIERFGKGDGSDGGDWTVPGEFGHSVTVSPENTTLFAGDQDMFVFLADERNRVELPARRNGQPGLLARGFFVWNSEVGASTLGIATFLFDYVCCNRIVWGATQYRQLAIRHTPKAPVRWADEVAPALEQYRNAPTDSIVTAIERARQARIDDPGDWLAKRFGKRLAPQLHDLSLDEEGHPVETLWDAATALTAYARRVGNQDARVELERKAGELLDLAA